MDADYYDEPDGPPISLDLSDDDIPAADGVALPAEEKEELVEADEVMTRDMLTKLWEDARSNDLRTLCKIAGIKQSSFINKYPSLTSLDIFQEPPFSIEPIQHLRHLRDVQVITQPELTELSGFQALLKLERLCVKECGLSRISNLQNCSMLLSLDLSDNNISSLSGLEPLLLLETLWLNGNKVARLDGFPKLPNLKVLWLCRNGIEKLGSALDKNSSLEEVNLGDNLIGCFKELLNLTRLPNLRNISFNDPHFGKNPVCDLCNYQTYVLYHLSQVDILDTVHASEEAKQLAEATYMKKKMYYNMRIKTLKRNTTNVIRKALEAKTTRLSHIGLGLNVLLRQRLGIERELEEARFLPPRPTELSLLRQELDPAASEEAVSLIAAAAANPTEYHEQLRGKLRALSELVDRRLEEVEELSQMFQALKQRVIDISEESISRLVIELETGGNIRLEEGRPTDVWFTSCADLVKSRFFSKDLAALGIADVKVARVTRIHNRFLRNRFESKVDELKQHGKKRKGSEDRTSSPEEKTDSADGDDDSGGGRSKRNLNYLFYGEHPSVSRRVGTGNELLMIVEDGFRPCDAYAEMNLPASICLSNSLTLSDAPRIRSYLSKLAVFKELATGNLADEDLTIEAALKRSISEPLPASVRAAVELVRRSHLPLPEGQLLIVKTYLGSDTSPELPLSTDSKAISAERYPEELNVQQSMRGDSKQRVWHVFDRSLVLPEYLIELEYATTAGVGGEPLEDVDVATAIGRAGKPLNAVELADLAPLMKSLQQYTKHCSSGAEDSSPYEERCAAVLNMQPLLPPRERATAMTEDVLLRQTRVRALDRLVYLNLHGNGIKKVEGLDACIGLQHLILTFNEIHKIEGLDKLVNLQRLALSYNLIKRIEGLASLVALKTLDMASNLLYRLEDMNTLRKQAPQLERLSLKDNALCDVKSYRTVVLRRMVQLVELDGTVVTDEDREAASETHSSITAEMILATGALVEPEMSSGMSLRGRSREPLSASMMLNAVAAHSPKGITSASAVATAGMEDKWWEQVEQLDLSHRKLRRLHNLERMVNLRRASFADNELSRVEGLERCVLLEELCLEENRIMKLEGLDFLVFMKKLDLGKNKLAKIEGVDSLIHLTQLSLEDNDIQSLAGLTKLSCLMELYIGNNRISVLKEIQHLKDMPKLIILDLSGNPVCQKPQYRLYCIYYIRKLKVLDGCGVDSAEQAAAREKYSGKLTTDFLVEKIGHKYFEHIRELDLSACRIRQIESLSGDDFCNLRELNLDNNLISDLSGFTKLTHLTVLRLNNNRVIELPLQINTGLAGLPNLEVLQLSSNHITDIESLHLHTLPHLKVLSLAGNEITRLSGLEGLSELRELSLDRNRLKHLDANGLAGLVNLRELRVEENGIRTMSSFRNMPKLQVLFLSHNRISDVSELDRLDDITFLLEITMTNNPVARKQMYRPKLLRKLPTLKFIDGKEVTSEERERVELMLSQAAGVVPGAMSSMLSVSAGAGPPRGIVPQFGSILDPRVASTGVKIPVKLTSVNFESLTGFRHPTQATANVGYGLAEMAREERWSPANATAMDSDPFLLRSNVARPGKAAEEVLPFARPESSLGKGRRSPSGSRHNSFADASLGGPSFGISGLAGRRHSSTGASLAGPAAVAAMTLLVRSTAPAPAAVAAAGPTGRRPLGSSGPRKEGVSPRAAIAKKYSA